MFKLYKTELDFLAKYEFESLPPEGHKKALTWRAYFRSPLLLLISENKLEFKMYSYPDNVNNWTSFPRNQFEKATKAIKQTLNLSD